jgi:hypothetical protein
VAANKLTEEAQNQGKSIRHHCSHLFLRGNLGVMMPYSKDERTVTTMMMMLGPPISWLCSRGGRPECLHEAPVAHHPRAGAGGCCLRVHYPLGLHGKT